MDGSRAGSDGSPSSARSTIGTPCDGRSTQVIAVRVFSKPNEAQGGGILGSAGTDSRRSHTIRVISTHWPSIFMKESLPKLVWATTFALLVLSFLSATSVRAVCMEGSVCRGPPPIGGFFSEPVWATLNAATQGNYPGGNETFYVFVVTPPSPPTVTSPSSTSPLLPPRSLPSPRPTPPQACQWSFSPARPLRPR